MVRLIYIFIILISTFCPLQGVLSHWEIWEIKEEVDELERLITCTEDRLADLKKIKLSLQDYEKALTMLERGQETPQVVGTLFLNAKKLNLLVKQRHLEHVFSARFLQDLQFLCALQEKGEKR